MLVEELQLQALQREVAQVQIQHKTVRVQKEPPRAKKKQKMQVQQK